MKVVDASAVLAFILQESGADIALAAFPSGAISAVNAAEVMSKMSRRGVPARQTLARLARLGLTIESADADQAATAADLANVKELSLGDRFCVALAHELSVPVVTSDRIWATLGLPVSVELIR